MHDDHLRLKPDRRPPPSDEEIWDSFIEAIRIDVFGVHVNPKEPRREVVNIIGSNKKLKKMFLRTARRLREARSEGV